MHIQYESQKAITAALPEAKKWNKTCNKNDLMPKTNCESCMLQFEVHKSIMFNKENDEYF